MSYDVDDIVVLTYLEAVRKRPGMYIGSTGPRGLHHLVYEVVDNSIDEALAGYCTHIEVELNADGSVTVTDDGRGIATDIHPKTGKSTLETVMTVMTVLPPRGSKKYGDRYKYKVGGNGIGIFIVNALSEWLEVTVWDKQQVYAQRFERGIPVTELQTKPSQEIKTGTAICFKPDPVIFTTTTEFDCTILAERLRIAAYLNAGLKITFSDRRPNNPTLETYHYTNGIREYVAYLNREKHPLHEEVIYIQGDRNNVRVEIALQWCGDADNDKLLSFANNINTICGGTHEYGLKAGITHTLKAIARSTREASAHFTTNEGENYANLTGEYLRAGLTGIISVMVPEPEFGGPVKQKLINAEVRGIVSSLVINRLTKYLKAKPTVADAILERAIGAMNRASLARARRALDRHKPSAT